MIARLGCLFVLVPLLELFLLLQLGRWMGVWPTVLLVAVTGLGGAVLARTQGLRTLASVQLELARGRLPGRALMDGASILVGGAFLMTPGILTDLAGFALLFPLSRRLIQGWVLARLGRAIRRGTLHVTWVGMERFGMRPPGAPGRPGQEGRPEEGTVSGGEGRGEVGDGPGRPRKEGKRGPDDDEPRPPRPGEIIQE